MVIDEHVCDDGTTSQTTLQVRDGVLLLSEGERAAELPPRAVIVTMRRYGRPLDTPLDKPAAMTLDDQHGLAEFDFQAVVDVLPRRYVLLLGPDEPVAALASQVAAALRFLAFSQHD